MSKGYVTIKLAAEILGVSIETLRNWDKSGKLQAKRDDKNSYRLYKISELEKFAEGKHLKKHGNNKIRLIK